MAKSKPRGTTKHDSSGGKEQGAPLPLSLAPVGKGVLTFSAISTFRACQKKFQFNYDERLTPRETPKYFTQGNAWHRLLELLYNGDPDPIKTFNAETTVLEKDIETLAVMQTLFKAYLVQRDRFQPKDSNLYTVGTEIKFLLPIVDENGAQHPVYKIAGKIDRIVREQDVDGLWTMEHKTTSDSLDSYMLNNYNAMQNSIYFRAVQQMFPKETVRGVLFNVCKKPSIHQTAKETFEQYLERLFEDASSRRPEFYFRRERMYRNAAMQKLTDRELWASACDIFGRSYFTHNFNECKWCPYNLICPEDSPSVRKEVYRIRETIHQELLSLKDATITKSQ